MPPIPLHPPQHPRNLVRLPGLYRRWDLAQVLTPGWDHHVEAAGETRDGSPLFAVYRDRASGPVGDDAPDTSTVADGPDSTDTPAGSGDAA